MPVQRFPDRRRAGESLAVQLRELTPAPAVVAAIPRGGVIVAAPIAGRLGVPLTLVHARKLTVPPAPELAFAAVDEDGHTVVDYPLIAALRLSSHDVDAARERVQAEIRSRRERYAVPPLASFLPAECVVLVDDGLATGLTMDAAVAHARRHGAEQVVVAAPCASPGAAARFGDPLRLLTLVVDPGFRAVADYYADFPQVEDEEVRALLDRLASAPRRAPPR